jgi:cytochrome c peroxidase
MYEKAIDRAERDAVSRFTSRQIFPELVANLGEAIFFDAGLSVQSNQACAFCHDPRAGFRGGIASINQAGGVMPGSVRYRIGFRVPQSLAYAAGAPVFSWDDKLQNFTGGNFWDGRAMGTETQPPALQQAKEPFTNPLEMAFPDTACAVYRVRQAPYRAMFLQIWGNASAAISWPASTAKICRTPAGGTAKPHVPLTAHDRSLADTAFDRLLQTIMAFETSSHASLFSSKFDAWQSGLAKLTGQEQRGYALFTGAAHCAACHTASGQRPVFTNDSYANIAVPQTPPLAYLAANKPDASGYVSNPDGVHFQDHGLAKTLAASSNPAWRQKAPQFEGAFAVPTLRNVAAQEARGLSAVYMHNGAFTHLADIIAFLNKNGIPPQAASRAKIPSGALRLTKDDEAALAAFLQTLTDGYFHPGFSPGTALSAIGAH